MEMRKPFKFQFITWIWIEFNKQNADLNLEEY